MCLILPLDSTSWEEAGKDKPPPLPQRTSLGQKARPFHGSSLGLSLGFGDVQF